MLAGLYPKRYSPDAEGGGDHLLVLDSGRAGCQCCDGRIAKEAVWGLTASIRSFSLIAHCLKSNSKKLPDTQDDRFIYEGV